MNAQKAELVSRSTKYKQHVDVVVYTMGKVGSSSVSTSLIAAGFSCLDIHFWEKGRYLEFLAHTMSDPEVPVIPKHAIETLMARNALAKQKRLKIISLVRNPIMRNISAVFQNMPKSASGDMEQMIARLRNYSVRMPDHWFEKDFIPTTGLNVLEMDLDRSADHYRFETDLFDILIMKLEIEDERKSALISQFMRKPVELERTNEAKKKWYFEAYSKIVNDPDLVRPGFVQECLRLKSYRAFYAAEDALRLAQKYGAGV